MIFSISILNNSRNMSIGIFFFGLFPNFSITLSSFCLAACHKLHKARVRKNMNAMIECFVLYVRERFAMADLL